ncbi:methylase of chemotaxis methyl-accepting protein [Halobacteroides halobius DSM 5150]|uniref:Methylase of chemotaxis methyl-accepting protein n=1 Tax=Halobacteroides halobius (strain ATCC 35273 / DSM 5150 / MD-1) TaxID=748449 RepID=L0KEF5_HALHC|nr:protein-glutamate O-methyltransferase CheR [Halobacteroides halobius]AGB42443.1 methylase of chemotaxis methyl-accepting protein [Halobacteroides halobius DSM 5150]
MDFEAFINQVSQKIKVDFTSYKQKRVKRRTKNFIKKHNLSDYKSCFDKIKTDPQFKREFLEHMTINTTEFFRNPDNYKYLQEEVLPKLLKKHNKIKIWSAASSIGCEAYTIAIILNQLGVGPKRYEIKATDIDSTALATARKGKYKPTNLKKVDQSIIDQYFTKENNNYLLDAKIKQQVKFKRLNLLKDDYETNINLILCRNVFIYFTKEIKNRLTQKLSQALTDDGILFLGNTEYLLQPKKYNLEKLYTSFYKKA